MQLTEKDAKAAMAVLKEWISAGNEVGLNGFGKFEIKVRPERDGRNPKTGETIKIAESKTVTFSVSKTFKKELG